MKTIKRIGFGEIDTPLPFEVDITEEELEEYGKVECCTVVLLKEIEKLKEYVDKNFVRQNTITTT